MEPLTPLPSISRACTMEPQHKSPAFLKPYLPDCENRLQIHPTFSPFMESSVMEKASLRNGKGKLWPVEVAKIGDNFYFQQGWKIFIEENHIEYGDLLACHYKGDNIFDLKNLGKEATQKQINEAFDFKGKEKQEPADDVQNQTTLKRKAADFENFDEYYCYNYRKTGHTNGYPYFVMKSKKRNKKGRLVVNASETFNDNGVILKKVVDVKDPYARSWRLKVSLHEDGRLLLKDWDEFFEYNLVDNGEECVCVILGGENPYIQVHINQVWYGN